jgi:hypothetical protein
MECTRRLFTVPKRYKRSVKSWLSSSKLLRHAATLTMSSMKTPGKDMSISSTSLPLWSKRCKKWISGCRCKITNIWVMLFIDSRIRGCRHWMTLKRLKSWLLGTSTFRSLTRSLRTSSSGGERTSRKWQSKFSKSSYTLICSMNKKLNWEWTLMISTTDTFHITWSNSWKTLPPDTTSILKTIICRWATERSRTNYCSRILIPRSW